MSKRWKDDQKYWVSGSVLNEFDERIRDGKLIQGDGVKLTEMPGHGTVISALEAGSSAPGKLSPWSLIIDPDTGNVSVKLGTVMDPTDKFNSGLTCTNPAHSFSVVSGDYICLKITARTPADYTIVKESGWPIAGGYFVAVTRPDSFPVFDYSLYPLHQVVSATHPDAETAISATASGVELGLPFNYVIQNIWQRISATERLTVPWPTPGPRVAL